MPTGNNRYEYAVVGLGQFGASVALRLHELGYGVLGIDRSRAIVQALADQLPNLLVMDATDEDALAAIEIATFDMVLVAIGDDLARAIILVIALKDMGVRHVICKAMNDHDGRILLRVGADEIVMPEYEYGRWTAERLAIRGAKTVQEVEPGVILCAMQAPPRAAGISLGDLALNKNGIEVLLLAGSQRQSMPSPNTILAEGDTLWLLGSESALRSLTIFRGNDG